MIYGGGWERLKRIVLAANAHPARGQDQIATDAAHALQSIGPMPPNAEKGTTPAVPHLPRLRHQR